MGASLSLSLSLFTSETQLRLYTLQPNLTIISEFGRKNVGPSVTKNVKHGLPQIEKQRSPFPRVVLPLGIVTRKMQDPSYMKRSTCFIYQLE